MRAGQIYLHVFDWPAAGQIKLPGLPVTNAYLLADPAKSPLSISHTGNGVTIQGPAAAPDPINTVVVLTVQEPMVHHQ
jgi:alpha-L-fucosidase